MTDRLTYTELAVLMKKGAGVTVDPRDMEQRPGSAFDEYGLDSLGLLGIVGVLENRHGRALAGRRRPLQDPQEFLDLVNNSLMTGA